MTSITIAPKTENSCNDWLCCIRKPKSPKETTETIIERTEASYKHYRHPASIHSNSSATEVFNESSKYVFKRKVSRDSGRDEVFKSDHGSYQCDRQDPEAESPTSEVYV